MTWTSVITFCVLQIISFGISAPSLLSRRQVHVHVCVIASCVVSGKFAATNVGSALHLTQARPIMINHLSGIPGQALSTQSLIVIT